AVLLEQAGVLGDLQDRSRRGYRGIRDFDLDELRRLTGRGSAGGQHRGPGNDGQGKQSQAQPLPVHGEGLGGHRATAVGDVIDSLLISSSAVNTHTKLPAISSSAMRC